MISIDVLGNAYLHNYFANSRKLTELQAALKAYTQAVNQLMKLIFLLNNRFSIAQELNAKWDNPDLYNNRGEVQFPFSEINKETFNQICLYLEEYSQAIDSYNRADTLDDGLNAKEKAAKIIEINDAIQDAIDKKVTFPALLKLIFSFKGKI